MEQSACSLALHRAALASLALLLAAPEFAAQRTRPGAASPFTPTVIVPERYRLRIIELPPGFTYPYVSRLNESGHVVGSCLSLYDFGASSAFVWTPESGTVLLGGSESAGLGTTARDINRRDVIVGAVLAIHQPGLTWLSPPEPFYDPSNYLPLPPPSPLRGNLALNDGGTVLGGADWVWDPVRGTRTFAELGFFNAFSAHDINESNQVAGSVDRMHACRFDLATGKHVVLGSLGGEWSDALGINDHGHVVGWSLDAEGRYRPFRWTPATGMQALGDASWEGIASSVNGAGQVVGWATHHGRNTAFLWDAGHGMRALGPLVDDLGTLELVGAADINEAGWIVGSGTDAATGETRGCVLRPKR